MQSFVYMTKAVVLTVLFFGFSASAEYQINSVPIRVRNETQSFFDVRSLAEMASDENDENTMATVAKLGDFFTSTGFHFEANGRYTTFKNGYYANSYVAPGSTAPTRPIFEIEVKVTPAFIRAFAIFMGIKAQNLAQLANRVYSQLQNVGSPFSKINFDNFYTCLRTISVSPYVNMTQLSCLADTIRSLGLKDERPAIELANTYMVMYRASRLSFQSSKTINVEEPQYKEACVTYQKTLIGLQVQSSRMMFVQQPGYWAMMLGRTAEFDDAMAFYIATPRITDLLGPYVTALELPDKDYLETNYAQRRICLF